MIRVFVMTTLRNLVVRLEKSILAQVLNTREQGRMVRSFSKPLVYKFALDGLLRGDPKTQAEMFKNLHTMGITSVDEVRQEFGFNPKEGEGGDYHLVNGGMARLEKIDEQGSRAANTRTEEPAAYNKDLLIDALSRLYHAEAAPAQVQGATMAHEPLLQETAIELAQDALDRIHKITQTQISRWREQDPSAVDGKLAEFWAKQRVRLGEALVPAEKVLGKISEGSFLGLEDKYIAYYSSMDSHQVMGHEAKDHNINVEEYVHAIIG
jgi:hypothetical protein